ncbi:unnamed protein product [Malus baccata var. baccata]
MASLSLSKLEQLRLHQRRQWSLRFCWTPYLSICSKWHSSWKLYTEQLVGLVPSGVVLPLMQWVGRAHFLYVVRQTHEYSLCGSTQIGVIRYPHYAFNCTGSCPSWITYLRYTAFVVLYPPGMTGETWLMYPTSFYKEEKPLLRFLRWLSFSYYNFLRVCSDFFSTMICCFFPLFQVGTHGREQVQNFHIFC